MLHGTGTIMMHIPYISSGTKQEDKPGIRAGMDALKKSIEELSPLVRGLGIPLAVENMPNDTFETIKELLAEFPPDIIGVCYDSGHGNMYESKGLDNLETCSDRLEALHLHDNDSTSDQHQPPFMGNIDWHRVMGIIAKSSYKREISFEMSIGNTPFKEDPKAFLADAYKRCSKAIQA